MPALPIATSSGSTARSASLDRWAVGHVGLHVAAPTDSSDRPDPLRGLVLADAIDHRDAGAATGELERHRMAEVARGARDGDAEAVELS
jgi:hypothetical protein